jgi:hypothetical protein
MTDDSTSISILKSIAQARLGPEAGVLPPTPELRSALAAEFGSADAALASEGELARVALDLLRQDAAFAEPTQLTSSQGGDAASRQRYVEPVTIGLVTAAVLALQTRVKFKLDDSGKWSIEVDKRSSGDAAVKLLVQRLLPYLGK